MLLLLLLRLLLLLLLTRGMATRLAARTARLASAKAFTSSAGLADVGRPPLLMALLALLLLLPPKPLNRLHKYLVLRIM